MTVNNHVSYVITRAYDTCGGGCGTHPQQRVALSIEDVSAIAHALREAQERVTKAGGNIYGALTLQELGNLIQSFSRLGGLPAHDEQPLEMRPSEQTLEDLIRTFSMHERGENEGGIRS